MRILRKILIILAIALLVISAIGLLFFSSHVHMDRSIKINAKPATVFNYISDLHNYNKWSPWYKKDPDALYTYSGTPAGKGASLSWVSKVRDVGKGKMTITEADPDSTIKLDMVFMETNVANSSFRINPDGEGSKVTWAFDAEAGMNPISRIFGGFMDKMLGPVFDSGLVDLKKNLEEMHPSASDIIPSDTTSSSVPAK